MTFQFRSLLAFIKNKFAISKIEAQVIQDARNEVNENHAAVADTIYKDSFVSVCKLEELIKQLSKNSSPDMDGVTAKHLTYCIRTDLIHNLSVMFSLCIYYGVVPGSFRSVIRTSTNC